MRKKQEIQIQLDIFKLIHKFPIKLSIADLVVTPNVSIPDHFLSTTEQTVYTVKLGIKHSLVLLRNSSLFKRMVL